MRMREHLERASMRGIPDWLVQETPSRDGGRLQDEWARRLADPRSDDGEQRVAAAMLNLRSQRPTRPLLGRANGRALRWVESAVNRSRLAQQLRTTMPTMRLSHRLLLRLHGYVWGAATALLVLLVKIGFFTTIDGVTRVVERLSRLHIDRHIGPMT